MNLPSPDEQLDLHGPRAQLPFEQIPPQSRAGVKSSHESQEQDKALIVSNCIITSGGTPDGSSPNQEILVSPGSASASSTGDDQKRPDRAAESMSMSDSVTVTNKKECSQALSISSSPCPPTINRDEVSLFSGKLQQQAMVDMDASKVYGKNEQQKDESHVADQPSTSFLSRLSLPWRAKLNHGHHAQSSATTMRSNVRPRVNACDFGTVDAGFGEDSNGIPPARATRFQNLAAMFKRFMGFVGPGYIISVGYMDPGNWATDLAGGSSFGYMLLFVILCSNLMAVVLQGLAVKLGVVTGLDLAQACRKFTPKYVNWILYVLAELAIIACDLAEVIGSAIALNLLFNIPLPWGVVITAADVLIILIAFRDDQSVKSRRLFEALVILLVSAVGVCFTLEIVYSQPVAKDVLRGFLPSAEILTNKEALYLAIGIIGATVMPHNLYLHSSIVKLRTRRELNDLASSQASMSSTSNLMTEDQRQLMLEGDKSTVSMKHSTIRRTLKYTFWDSTVALTFALYVNSAILIVSAATFKYKYPDANNEGLADFFDAFHLLSQYLGKAAGYVFAVALLMAGQSSTLTATLAGQIIMEGFLGTSYLKPWIRRLLTRCLAIIPALIIVIIKGQDGLSELLLASQVALSIQLPFAVIPLVLFTSMGRCMTISVSDNEDRPGEMKYGMQYEKDATKTASASATATYTGDSDADVNNNRALAPGYEDHINIGAVGGQIAAEAGAVAAYTPGRASPQLMHNFANPWWLVIISGIISIILLGLNFYLLVGTIQGKE
ncbi:hypothetical protein BGZ51_006206 [Haplosporangium sp. Z 767]|nr:hypothetical protein BGZ51_006206 [Haplosporangium sp. Z 767]